MFDISWSELLILAVVTLIFVGPKDLPRLLGTVGRYVGVARRHANEFRQVFDQAMREAELADVKREVEKMQEEVNASVLEAERKASGVASKPVAKTEAVPAPLPDAVPSALPTSLPDALPHAVEAQATPPKPDGAA